MVLISGVPMAAFADDSDACAGTGHWSKRWATDTQTGVCVKLYDNKGNYVGPSYMAPQPNQPVPPEEPATPSPSPTPTPTPTPSVEPVAGTSTTVNDSGNNNATGVGTTTDANGNIIVNNKTDVTNTLDSQATTGDAKVKGNESNGSATSGNAAAETTVVNSVHSSVDGGQGVAHFTYDVNGDVIGDITLNGNSGPVNINNSTDINSNTTVNNDTALTNNLNLNATSGGATVQGNESSGSATSGSANTVANVLNLINTIIAANQSFIGTINIYGNLNGDILMSPELIPQLIASNGGNVYSSSNLALTTNINDDNSIVNNIKLNASSGNASVQGNDSNGSAISGSGQTNLTILNLTGHQVNASNSLLVFVNVLGTWVGMIVDAPGATAAALGTGVISSTTDVTGTANLNNKAVITNNLDLTSQTGNATVGGNESSGNATSGNATASANVANISTSTFNLTGWFGVLYINVFGKWLGSFGVDTAAGTVAPVAGMAVEDKAATIGAPNLHFGFVPKTDPLANLTTANTSTTGTQTPTATDPAYQGAVLAAAIKNGQSSSPAANETLTPIASPREDPFSIVMMITGFTIAGGAGIVWLFRRWF
ncbi:MAG: mucin7-like protein [Candidatus Saccharibacteria bacterium]|nr:mucin7-like protein [Candidatus Saccharibacteria bacterium]